MPASFISELCGYRGKGVPNMSDRSQAHSKVMSRALLANLGIPPGTPAPGENKIGALFDNAVAVDLTQRLAGPAPHLTVEPQSVVSNFEQYVHLQAIKKLSASGSSLPEKLRQLEERIGSFGGSSGSALEAQIQGLIDTATTEETQRRLLLDSIGDESVLKLDVAVSRRLDGPGGPGSLTHLVAGLSVKWTLRTDRMQDPISQGAKLASVRRGRMPHFAAITVEPRPYMINMLARGSGGLDCVYHLDLPTLIKTVDEVCISKRQLPNRDEFHRLVDQRRIRDYDDLATYLETL
jgi:hypothetical protein